MINKQSGVLMIMASILLVVMSVAAAMAVSIFTTQITSASSLLASTQVGYLAESGLEKGVASWLRDPENYRGEGPVEFGAGVFTISISGKDANGRALLPNQVRISSLAEIKLSPKSIKKTNAIIINKDGLEISP